MGKSIDINLERVHELYNQGLSDAKIAEILGCARKVISRRRKKLNLPPNPWQSIATLNPEKIKQLFAEGKSSAEIGRLLHISTATLCEFKKKYNIKTTFDMKMSKEDITKAMQLAQEGLMDSEIAKIFGVTRGNIFFLRKVKGIKSKFSYDKISKIDNNKFKELFHKGLRDKEIAKIFGMTSDGVYAHRIRHGYFRESYREAKDNPLTQDNLEIILGTLMGDASMEKVNKNARLTLAHGEKQKEYTYYISEKLSNLNPHTRHSISKLDSRTGKKYDMYWCEFPANPSFNNIYKSFYKNGKKRIPMELFENFTWQSLAYMFMDDGCKCSKAGLLATNCFSIRDLEKFKRFLKKKFNIETTIRKNHTLYIKTKSFRWMASNIEPYMCECTKYKISNVLARSPE